VCAVVLFKRLCKLICRLVVQTGILFVLGQLRDQLRGQYMKCFFGRTALWMRGARQTIDQIFLSDGW
jgi:hypothetical protein